MLTHFEGTSPRSRGLTAAQQRTVRAKRVPRTRSLSDGQACGGQSAEMVKGRPVHPHGSSWSCTLPPHSTSQGSRWVDCSVLVPGGTSECRVLTFV